MLFEVAPTPTNRNIHLAIDPTRCNCYKKEDRKAFNTLLPDLFIIDILAAPMLSKLSSSPDVLSNASGGQLNVGIGSSIGADAPSTVLETNSRSIPLK